MRRLLPCVLMITLLLSGCRPVGGGETAEEAETLAGLLLDLKGDFPEEKESFSLGGIDFTVLRIERHRIISVKVRINE